MKSGRRPKFSYIIQDSHGQKTEPGSISTLGQVYQKNRTTRRVVHDKRAGKANAKSGTRTRSHLSVH